MCFCETRSKELASHPRGARRPKSKLNTLTTRVRPASFRQSAPQKRPLSPLQKLIITHGGPTGPVGDAYHKKSWLRTLVVLGDQSRSRTTWQCAWGLQASDKVHPIDQHALGLRAPGRRVLYIKLLFTLISKKDFSWLTGNIKRRWIQNWNSGFWRS
jgi:hypothetical protein